MTLMTCWVHIPRTFQDVCAIKIKNRRYIHKLWVCHLCNLLGVEMKEIKGLAYNITSNYQQARHALPHAYDTA